VLLPNRTSPRGEYVIEYTGQLLSRRNHKAICGKRRYVFTYTLDGYWTLDGAVRGSGAERVNHSCDPNLYAEIRGHRVYFYSLRRIKKGEELTVDYQFEYSKTPVPCLCGASKCRGTINLLKGQASK
jgi:SET domain-containing protein